MAGGGVWGGGGGAQGGVSFDTWPLHTLINVAQGGPGTYSGQMSGAPCRSQ